MNHFAKLHLQTAEKNGKTYTIGELQNFPPFPIKRFYFVQGQPTDTGQHCHKIEEEFFVMIKGNCTAVIDQGKGKEDVEFYGPGEALYVPNYVWHGFKNMSEDAILLALSSTNFNPDRSDYVEDYEEYLKIRDEGLRKGV